MQKHAVFLLAQRNRYFAGIGMFTDVIEQLLQQAIQCETHRFIFWRIFKLIVKPTANAAFGKGKFIHQMMQCIFKGQFIERGRPQLAQQLAGGVVNAPGKVVDLICRFKRLLATRRALDQLRLNLNGGDVLTNFVV